MKHRRDFGKVVAGAHSALTTSRFARLMAYSILYVLLGLPLAVIVPATEIKTSGTYLDYSYGYFKQSVSLLPKA